MLNDQQLSSSMPPHVPSAHMENLNQNVSSPPQLSAQGYNQLQSSTWAGNKVCQGTLGQNSSIEPYSQQMNRYYQASYASHQSATEMPHYMSAVPSNHHSVPSNYSTQYAPVRQNNYPSANSQTYQPSANNTCGNTYYGNVNSQTSYGMNSPNTQQRKYANSPLCPSRAIQGSPQNIAQLSHNAGNVPQQSQMYSNKSVPHTRFMNNYNIQPGDGQMSCVVRHQLASTPSSISSNQGSPPVLSPSVHNINQLSSIPTPPETSSMTGDTVPMTEISVGNINVDSSKSNQVSSSSFALPCTTSTFCSGNLSSATYTVTTSAGSKYENSRTQNYNSGSSLPPPPNLDEGSQASSASASSSIPDEQNSSKASSKPNFSYPPTPNTLSSPGAASMSSFHDDLECISSPGWPRTPASPVANSNYEFSNIKRPDSLLKLYNLSEDPERRYFLDKLLLFNEDRGSPITQCPTISKQPLDVFRVYLAVKERGGFVEVTNAKRWKDIAGAIGVGASSSAAYTLRKQYMKLLLPFECKFDRGGIDPQPIINQVEASSRKKGKNAGNSGNPNHLNQGYPQAMDGYHAPNYSASYSTSRHYCNSSNIDYSRSPNAMHYPQASSHHTPTVTNTVVSGQTQYNQYWQNQQAYGYYKGNNSNVNQTTHTSQTNVNNMCRFSNNMPSQPAEREYYQQHYASHSNTAVQNSAFSNRSGTQEGTSVNNFTINQAAVENDNFNYRTNYTTGEHASKNFSQQPSDHSTPRKQLEDSYNIPNSNGSCVPSASQDPMSCYDGNYSTPKPALAPDNCATPNGVCSSTKSLMPSVVQPYQQQNIENNINRICQPDYQGNNSPSLQCRDTISNESPQCDQQASQNADYQTKSINQANQFAQYVESQTENYRGIEEPTSFQAQPVDSSITCKPNDNVPINQQPYHNGNAQTSVSNYSVYNHLQAQTNEIGNSSVSKDQYNHWPNRGWSAEQSCQYRSTTGQCHVNKSSNKDIKNVAMIPRVTKSKPLSICKLPKNENKSYHVPKTACSNSVTATVPLNKSQATAPAPPVPPLPSAPLVSSNNFQHKNMRHFPPNSVEAVNPVFVRRKRYIAKDVAPLEAWRLMLALRSGLIGECSWALDVLSILLCDNNSVVFFGLHHLPGLLEVLVEHYRCFLNKIFGLAEDLEVGYRPCSAKNVKPEVSSSNELPKDGSANSLNEQRSGMGINWRERTTIFDTKNYTYNTRCKKSVRIKYDEALFLIDPERKWDKYEGFNSGVDHWQMGGGEMTMHIQTDFDSGSGRVRFARDLELEKSESRDWLEKKRNSAVMSDISFRDYSRNSLKLPLLSYKGEPFVVLEKFCLKNIKGKHSQISQSDDNSDTEVKGINSLPENASEETQFKKSNKRKIEEIEFDEIKENIQDIKPVNTLDTETCRDGTFCVDLANSKQTIHLDLENNVPLTEKSISERSENQVNSINSGNEQTIQPSATTEEDVSSSKLLDNDRAYQVEKTPLVFPRLRLSPSCRKKQQPDVLEDEASSFDEPALFLNNEAQEALSRRCMCISTILRNLSFVPGNDVEMKKHSSFLLILGRLLLLHHEHKPVTHRKYDKESKETESDDSCVSLKDEQEWWWSTLHALRDNTLVTLSNIAGQLDLTPFPEEISLPILDGLLHWVVCPSSYAQDPLPSQSSFSVLSPQRLSLEALCKLSVLGNNVDLMIATPPWSRIERLFSVLSKLLSVGEDQVLREFAVVLLSNISQADSCAARTIAEQNSCIPQLIAFIEQAESSAFQVASSQGIKALKENPELMGTTPDMVQRAASTLRCLASVSENGKLFFRHQQRLLMLVTSQIVDQDVASIIADILFYVSDEKPESSPVIAS